MKAIRDVDHPLSGYRDFAFAMEEIGMLGARQKMKKVQRQLLQVVFFAMTFQLAATTEDLTAQTTFSVGSEEVKVLQTISQALQDVSAGNFTGYRARLTENFYMFDGGKRFSADLLIEQLRSVQAAGVHYHWSVTKPDIHVEGATAWIAYVNEGSVTTGTGVQSRQWLESAFLVNHEGTWRVAFWHSTPVQPSQPPK
jgi:hypothetical protein